MSTPERRQSQLADRRRVPRGGRRTGDQPGRYPNLLVADGYLGARTPCVRYLDRFGFAVEEAGDASEALAAVAARPPHLILLAADLPEMAGWRVIHRLREQPDTRPIPVIFMTSDFDADRTRWSDMPPAAVLVKPFALSTMLHEIRRVLRGQVAAS